jgi:hypothetical protein
MDNENRVFDPATVKPVIEAIISVYAPAELPLLATLIKADVHRRRRYKDPLQFGVTDLLPLLTPHVAHAVSQVGPFILGVTYKAIEESSKDFLKQKIKDLLATYRAGADHGQDNDLTLSRTECVAVAERSLEEGGIEATRARELAVVIVASLVLASDQSGGDREKTLERK